MHGLTDSTKYHPNQVIIYTSYTKFILVVTKYALERTKRMLECTKYTLEVTTCMLACIKCMLEYSSVR